jgi:hypothetical protein
MDIAEVRKRIRHAIEQARRKAAARRAAIETAQTDYQRFLTRTAVPLLRLIATALTAEGFPFEVFTPAGSVRLASTRSGEDYIELALDTSGERPLVLGRVNRGRGRHKLTLERPLGDEVPISALTEEDVLQFVLEELGPFVER